MKKQNNSYVQAGELKERPDRPSRFSRQHLVSLLVRRRQRIMLVLIGFMLLMEIFEHVVLELYGKTIHIVYDTALYLLIMPLFVWMFVDLLKGTETEREKAAHTQDMHEEFSHSLGDASSWEALVQRITEYPHQIAPKASVALYVINPDSLCLQPEAACSREGKVTLRPQLMIASGSRPLDSVTSAEALFNEATAVIPRTANRFDLPVAHNGRPVGMIQLEYPPDAQPTPEEIRALKNAVPIMALAIERAQLQTLAAEQARASETQRQQIAQNLHDTLAQNISYLRLKLDQLTGENAIHEIGAVLQELERMRDTADEAYQQVRSTLDELDPTRSEDLVTAVFNQARAISQRAGFILHTSQIGAPYLLPISMRQHIIYIAREALHNVEKHASARKVILQFLWLDHEVILKISDDGLGFNQLDVPTDGHYGLWIMQHRAQEIGGNIKIESSAVKDDASTGTEVTLWVPRPVCADIPMPTEAQEPPCES